MEQSPFIERLRRRRMGTFIGIDGVPGGWVAVYLNENEQRFDYAHRLDSLLTTSHDRAMIDIPIGLPDRGYRQCDLDARRRIGSRVFLGARWNVWAFGSYPEANAYYWAHEEPGISKQLWCIRDKLQEVNESMTPERQMHLQETHPELIFWRLYGCGSLQNKKTETGRQQRLAILRENGLTLIDRWLGQRHGTDIGRDDLIDACACALAARDSTQRIPEGQPPLARRIRMEIWY